MPITKNELLVEIDIIDIDILSNTRFNAYPFPKGDALFIALSDDEEGELLLYYKLEDAIEAAITIRDTGSTESLYL